MTGTPTSTVPAASPELSEQFGWSLVWLGVLGTGLGLWTGWTSWPGSTVGGLVLAVTGLGGMVWTWLIGNAGFRVLRPVAFGASLAGVAAPAAVAIHVRQYYTTDSAAFTQQAGRALLAGKDPYTTSMAAAAALLKTPSNFWTYLTNGDHVTQVSYPAGSFLLEMPAMVLGARHEVADWMDLGAWLVAGVLLFAILPASLRWLAAVLLLSGSFVGSFTNGGTDALFMPFLIVAAWRWDRFGAGRQAGAIRWAGPVALGLACTVKQSPWFCVPFLVAGVVLESRRQGHDPLATAGRYLAVVVGVFALVNLPFLVWQPSAWLHGVLLPLTQPLVADGQGVVSLALHGLTGGVSLTLLSVAGFLVLAALWVAFVWWYPRLKRIWLLALPLALLVPPRSLSSYLVDFIPAALVAALTVSPVSTGAPAPRATRWWPGLLAVTSPLLAAGVVGAIAFTSAPLQLEVRAIHTSDHTQELDSVTVTVHNLTGHSVRPHFMVSLDSNHPEGFWLPAGRSRNLTLAPGASTTVTLRPALFTWAPSHGAYWLVQAYTSSPDALSTSPLQQWRLGNPSYS
jgi:hypothetical protein